MDLIYSLPLRGDGEYQLHWRLKPNKGFLVKEYYRCLCPNSLGLSLGRTFGRPRTAALGSLLTIDNFRKRNLIILDWCCICKQSGESVDHLLLHCSLARELWSMVFVLFDVNWVMPCHVFNLWACWQGHLGDQRKMVVWRMVPHCVMWCIWRERNAHHFEDCERSILELKLMFFQTLYEWVVTLGLFPINSMLELIDLCTF